MNQVLIPDVLEGYITWAEYETNVERLRENARVGVRQLLVHSAGSDGLTTRFSRPPTLGFAQDTSYTDLCLGTCARD
jgi:hypothetical protein